MMTMLLERYFQMVNYLKMEKEEGQGLVEYALILVLIAIVCITVLAIIGGNTNNALSVVGSALEAPIGT